MDKDFKPIREFLTSDILKQYQDYQEPPHEVINNKFILRNDGTIEGKMCPEILGLAGLLCPFADKISSQRLMMFCDHIFQFVIPNKPEFPYTFTGYELHFNDYCVNPAQTDKPIEILEVIPKYRSPDNPLVTVIYRDIESGTYDYFHLYKYYYFGKKYGFEYEYINTNKLVKGNIIEKGTTFLKAPNQLEHGEFCYGVNANVCFITDAGTWEDAIFISESFAKKLAPKKYFKQIIQIPFDRYPLNLYGDDKEYRIIPDIGEHIRDDGIICAFRKKEYQPFIDLHWEALKNVDWIADKIILGEPNAKIIDINVYINYTKFLKVCYDQILKYFQETIKYFRTIYNWYLKHEQEASKFSPKLNTLITNAIKYLLLAKVNIPKPKDIKNLKMVYKEKEKEEMHIILEITYVKEYDILPEGYKLTGRDGTKGIVCKVLPDDFMPVDDEGIRADIALNPIAVIKRTSFSQFYEQFINRGSELLIKRTKHLDPKKRFEVILEWISEFNPIFANDIKEIYQNNEVLFLEKIDKEGLHIHIPSTINITTKDILQLAEKYKINKTPITFKILDENKKVQTIRSKKAVMIGSKYILLLYKYPDLIATNVGFVNKYMIPTKNKKQEIFEVKLRPTRFGEDEHRMMMFTVHPAIVARTKAFNVSKKGIQKVVKTLINSESPTRIKRIDISDEELKKDILLLRLQELFLEIFGIKVKKVK